MRLSHVSGHRDVTAKWSVRRAEFSKMAVLLFFMWTLWAYFFPWMKQQCGFCFDRGYHYLYLTGRGKCILITTRKFGKKGFWSVLVSLQVRKIMWVRCGISLDKNSFFCKWLKSMRKLVASLQSSLYLTESIWHIINVREWTTKMISVFIRISFLRYNFAILLKWGWLRKFVINELFCSHFGSSVRLI